MSSWSSYGEVTKEEDDSMPESESAGEDGIVVDTSATRIWGWAGDKSRWTAHIIMWKPLDRRHGSCTWERKDFKLDQLCIESISPSKVR